MKTAQIKKISDTKVEVGGKPVFKDSNDNWVAQLPLTDREKHMLYKFLNKENMI